MRKIILSVSAAILIIGCVYFLSYRQLLPEIKPAEMAEETQNGPLEGVCIVVDAGHGGYDGGARAGQSKTWEKEINLQMAMQFRNALEAAGARVILTREEDKAFADKKRPDLDARLNMAREAEADMLLSVHMNQYHNARESGPQVFYRKAQQDSRLLAGCIQQAMIDDLQPQKARAALAGDYYMLSLDIPSVLVECGFISNPEEEKMLLDAGYQKRLAEAVCRGVCEFMVLCGVEQ